MTPEQDNWDCLAGPPPGPYEPWVIGTLAAVALIAWCIYG